MRHRILVTPEFRGEDRSFVASKFVFFCRHLNKDELDFGHTGLPEQRWKFCGKQIRISLDNCGGCKRLIRKPGSEYVMNQAKNILAIIQQEKISWYFYFFFLQDNSWTWTFHTASRWLLQLTMDRNESQSQNFMRFFKSFQIFNMHTATFFW